MIDIAASEEEIKRWKAAAEQEAAAGESIEQEFTAQVYIQIFLITFYFLHYSFLKFS